MDTAKYLFSKHVKSKFDVFITKLGKITKSALKDLLFFCSNFQTNLIQMIK